MRGLIKVNETFWARSGQKEAIENRFNWPLFSRKLTLIFAGEPTSRPKRELEFLIMAGHSKC